MISAYWMGSPQCSIYTQNFILISVSDDDVSILEKSVKSVKDWSDEDKIFDREISVPIPAAG